MPGRQDLLSLDPDKMRSELRAWQPRLVFLCNPNNPTGTVLPAERSPAGPRNFPIVCSLSMKPISLSDSVRSLLDYPRDNILVLRSMTKDFALAGLRLGFAVAGPKLIDALTAVQPPWSVNAMAQAAGLAALEDLEHVRNRATFCGRPSTPDRRFTQLGLAPYDSAGHFFLMHVGNGSGFSADVARARHRGARLCLVRIAGVCSHRHARAGGKSPAGAGDSDDYLTWQTAWVRPHPGAWSKQ